MVAEAEYAGMQLPGRLGIGEGDQVALAGAPQWLEDAVRSVPDIAGVDAGPVPGALYDLIVAFVTARAELEAELPGLREQLAPGGRLWIAWPQRAGGRAAGLTGQAVRELAGPAGLVPDGGGCSVDDMWTGLRLVTRRERRLPAARGGPASGSDQGPSR